MDTFADFYLRQSLAQSRPQHAGGSASPDILPWGASANPDPAALATAQSWLTDPGNGLLPGVDNFIYARTRNAGTVQRNGRMYLGAAPACYLCWPDTLSKLATVGGKSYVDMKVAAGGIGVGTSGFLYHAASAGDVLACWVYSLEHPVVPPQLDDVNHLRDFIMATPAYAQRSMAFGLEHGGYSHLGRYEQRAVDAVMVFEISWSACPVGWTVALLPENGDAEVTLGPFTISDTGGSLMCKRALPQGFAADLRFTIDSNGLEPSADAMVEVRVSLLAQTPDRGNAWVGAQALYPLGGHTWRPAPTKLHPHKAQGASHE